MQRQQTLSEVQAIGWVNTLNRTQQKILKLLATGEMTQSQIADRLDISRQYVNQLVKKLELYGLIQKKGEPAHIVRWSKVSKHGIKHTYKADFQTSDEAEAAAQKLKKYNPAIERVSRNNHYNICYELIPQVRQQVEKNTPEVKISSCRVHNIRLKYHISDTAGTLSRDKRAGYLSSWPMKGGDRHKFFVPGKSGMPDITIDIHPGTLVAYPEANSELYAETITEAETLIKTAIHEAVLKWIQKQRAFGSFVEIEHPQHTGNQITNTHYGFELSKDLFSSSETQPPQTTLEGWYTDGSPGAHGRPDKWDLETLDPRKATALDRGLIAILKAGITDPSVVSIGDSTAKLTQIQQQLSEIRQAQDSGNTIKKHLYSLSQVIGAMLQKQRELEARIISGPDFFEKFDKFT